MYNLITNFFVPVSLPHLLRLMVLLNVLVYAATTLSTVIFYRLLYPQLIPLMSFPYFVASAVVVTSVTVPFGYLLMATGLRLKEANERLEVISRTDYLTGLPNRGAFITQARAYIDGDCGPFALLLIDADEFKMLNDTYGHQCGDLALKVIARNLQAAVRDGDYVGRLGGEEFGVFLVDATQAQAKAIAQRIRQKISEELVSCQDSGAEFGFSVSVGGVHMHGSEAFEKCFRQADNLLYEAKHAGRNQVAFAKFDAENSTCMLG